MALLGAATLKDLHPGLLRKQEGATAYQYLSAFPFLNEDYVFGNHSQMLIDPAEDKLRSEFEGVQRSFIPMHSIVRIDEVEKEGVAKITSNGGEKVTPFPLPMPKDKK
jgi:hypothetical protein